jgi:hypothetical protein
VAHDFSFANTLANSATLIGGRYSAGKDVGCLGELIADDVGRKRAV